MNTHTTIAAIATGTGGAITIVRMNGKQAIAIADAIFHAANGKPLTQAKSHSAIYGTIVAQRADQTEEIIDDVLVSVFRAPHSYTGEDAIEISCHGSRYIAQRIMQLLIDNGATQAGPGEFTQRAFINGKLDLSQAEAIADLIASHSEATHQMAISQLRGGFCQELATLREGLLKLTTLLELELDFSEEDVEFANRSELHALAQQIQQRIQRLTHSFQTGNAIKNGIPVAIVGAPNVGKSTLLNSLVHEEKAIVSEIQGTTRDVIEDTIQIQGITFRFSDTAGIRHTHDAIELLGIERSLRAMTEARIVLFLSTSETGFPDIRIPEDKTVVHIITKCDQSYPDSSYIYNKTTPGGFIHISALTGAGLPLLEQELVRLADIPKISAQTPIVTNLRHYEALTRAAQSICAVIDALANNTPTVLVAQHLRQTLSHLAEITGGEITSEAVLSNLFSHFCIGK